MDRPQAGPLTMSIFIIDSESLANPLWLNSLDQIHIEIEYEPESSASIYHHVFFINGLDKQSLISQLQKEIKHSWYAFCVDENEIEIIYNNKIFSYTTLEIEYHDAVDYGIQQGIQKEFLDFHRYLTKYTNIIKKLGKEE